MAGPDTTLTDGSPVTDDHREINPETGMQKGYVVLSEDERAKGFVRPVRRSYVHVGPTGPTHPLRDLTADEDVRFVQFKGTDLEYVKFEEYPEDEAGLGRYWTRQDMDKKGKGLPGA